MFKTLFSKMLVTYLCVTLSLLLMLGITCSSLFGTHYIKSKQAELLSEGSVIRNLVVTKYVFEDKRPVAMEELATIARKYDGLIQLQFNDKKLGKAAVLSSNSTEKWTPLSEYYPTTDDAAIDGVIQKNAFSTITALSTMTLLLGMTSDGVTDDSIGLICFTVDMSETNKMIKSVIADVIVFLLLGIVLALLAVFYITDKMTKPITKMTKAVRTFSKGDYDARIQYKGADEVGELASSFNRMADEINNLETARRSFVANVSHELRSPLTSMRGFLVAMQDGTIPPEDYSKYLSIVIDESNRMILMVNDLLDMAKIESGEHVLKFESFDINETIRCTILTFEARIVEKSIAVSVELSEEPLHVEADKAQIVQVLRNLIDNAIKFTPNGGKLSISALVQRKSVWVCVKDSGAGISDEDMPYVFDRFYKAEKAHTPNVASGTGLGLAIAKKIMAAHGETIMVKNDNGACFMFSLKRTK